MLSSSREVDERVCGLVHNHLWFFAFHLHLYMYIVYLIPRTKVTDLSQYNVDEDHKVSGVEHSGCLL